MIIAKKSIIRFNNNINKTSYCWIWKKYTDRDGYGTFKLNNHPIQAHRLAWMISRKKQIPKGMFICHRCDNTSCVRPSHLFIGTHQDNMDDMTNKERQIKGEKQHSSKLTEKDIMIIRNKYNVKNYSLVRLAKQFNVTHAMIRKIVKYQSWKHVA